MANSRQKTSSRTVRTLTSETPLTRSWRCKKQTLRKFKCNLTFLVSRRTKTQTIQSITSKRPTLKLNLTNLDSSKCWVTWFPSSWKTTRRLALSISWLNWSLATQAQKWSRMQLLISSVSRLLQILTKRSKMQLRNYFNLIKKIETKLWFRLFILVKASVLTSKQTCSSPSRIKLEAQVLMIYQWSTNSSALSKESWSWCPRKASVAKSLSVWFLILTRNLKYLPWPQLSTKTNITTSTFLPKRTTSMRFQTSKLNGVLKARWRMISERSSSMLPVTMHNRRAPAACTEVSTIDWAKFLLLMMNNTT